MNPRSFYKLLITTVIAFITAVVLWVTAPDRSVGSFFGQPLFPGLMEKINEADVFSIEHDNKTFTFLRDKSGEWTLMEAAGYPADKERIRNVLIGLANLEKIEPKTALPEFYPDLQVEDSTVAKSKSYLVTLLNQQGERLAGLLIGKKTNGIVWNGQGYFVRFPEEAQSWLVRGNVDVTGDIRTWLATRLLPLSEGRLSGLTVIDGSKTREAVYKRTKASDPLTISFLSDGYFITAPTFVAQMEQTLTAFHFEDVAARPADLDKETPISSAFIETFDGLNIYVFFYLMDDKSFVAVSFSAAPDADDAVKKEAADLENKHARWLYQMPIQSVSALLPFLSVPEEKEAPAPTVEKVSPAPAKTAQAKKSPVKTKPRKAPKKK